MKFIFTICIFIFLLLLYSKTNAQNFSQTIYGKVISKSNLRPLNGASIEVLNTSPPLGTTSSPDGSFIVKNVLIGVYTLQISSIGYSTKTIENISVTTGKQVFLDVQLDEISTTLNEVVVQTETNKGAAVNSMTLTGVKTFSIEETQKYAAAVNDPSRMATSLPGVVAVEDVNNDISIRGNSPNGLLWRLEGIDISNPNHFANIGSSGGGISILSSQLLTNSDFLNGAFPAEYGNALSGVFDLKLRKGNNQRREFTFQAGFIGLDASTEGPFKQGYDGSYLVNYRYSSLSLFELLGIPLAEGVSKFQDLSFNIFLPTSKIGSLTVFGLGGLSSQADEKNLIDFLGNNELIHLKTVNESNTGVAGLTHLKIFNEKINVKSVLAVTGSNIANSQTKSGSSLIVIPISNQSYRQENISFSSTLNIKTGSLNWIRAGISPSILYYSVVRGTADSTNKLVNDLDQSGSAFLFNGFAQWYYDSENHFSVNLGIHFSWFALNQSTSIEPRAAMKYALNSKNVISFGYGLHSQIQPLGIYFFREITPLGGIEYPNYDLPFTKAHHLVLAYEYFLNKYYSIKLEAYYQSLFNVPISPDTLNPTSVLNVVNGYLPEVLVSDGYGKNYGIELTAERYLHKNFYSLFSASIYQSKYKAADGIWRNTRFNGNYAFCFTGGKDFLVSKVNNKSYLGINIRVLYSGGFRVTPIDVVKSEMEQNTILIDSLAFEEQLPPYSRIDLKLSYQRNFKQLTLTTSLDIQNLLNRENAKGQYYDTFEKTIQYSTQNGLIPILSIKVEF